MKRCPLCDQVLPKGVDEHEFHAKLQRLAKPALANQKRKMDQDFQRRLDNRVEAIEQKLNDECDRRIERAERNAERLARRAIAAESRFKIERLQRDREQERSRYRRDNDQLRRQVDELSRKLEKQSSEQLGHEGEINLLADLQAAFPSDDIEQVGRGAKGADIVHHVMDGPNRVGCIVYESKNVSTWQNQFVTKAKGCQGRYNTTYVVIVSRALPRRKRGLCTLKDIPIVEPQMAVALATILRDGIMQIGKLRLSQPARDGKAHELFSYVLSEEFATRFRRIKDSVEGLREQQDKEKNWHDKAWHDQSRLHDQIESGRREIDGRIKSITRDGPQKNGKRRAFAAPANNGHGRRILIA